MKPEIVSVNQQLLEIKPRSLASILNTESFKIFCQKFNGHHTFRHNNTQHDEIIYVLSGELKVWTESGEYNLKAGNLLKIPKGIEHGDLIGYEVEILVIEGTL